MSWDISIRKFSRIYASVEEISNEEHGVPLGSRSEVHAAVSGVFEGTDWSDPTWGKYDAPFGSIEFNLGQVEPIGGFMLHVRASEAVVAPIVDLCLRHGWQALDVSNGTFLEQSPVPEVGLREWLSYRNRVLGTEGA